MAFSFQNLAFPDLAGASVFITGGGSGIGAALTERRRERWVNDADLAECLDQQCLKAAIPVEDMTGPCLFLASSASRMMTGQPLVIDGGRS